MFLLLIILKVLFYLLLSILGLGLLLLIIPFSYKGQVLTAEGLKMELALGWAWKLLGINAEVEGEETNITLSIMDKKVYRIKSGGTEKKEEEIQEKPKEKKKKKEKRAREGFSIKEFANKELINEIIDYIRRVLDITKPKYMHLYGTYGFDDPSITGMLCGLTGMVESIIPHARVHLQPDFTQEIIDLDVRAEGSMVVGSLAYQTIRTVLKRPVRRILFKKKKS